MSSIRRGSRADQARDDVVLEIGDDRQLAAVQRGVADAVDALVGLDLQGDEVAARAGDDDPAPVIFMRVSSRRRANPAGPTP